MNHTQHEFNYGQVMDPCPWCGGIPLITYDQRNDEWSYGCRNSECPVQPGYHDYSPKECATEWNARTSDDPTRCPWCGKEGELQILGEYYFTCPNEWCVLQPSTWGHPTAEEAQRHWITRRKIP